ncbi:MAG TPA: glycosyltransferase [Solirubrobacteraceae bacterium]|nr:glycosyltransferase [Solirubrobacteraceae bacterium]
MSGDEAAAEPALSVLIRCRDERAGIGSLLDVLRAQTLGERLEVVVIDSGSRDGTIEEVLRRRIEPLRIDAADFSYGRALNRAAAEARADVCVAISAHALPPDREWAKRMVAAFDDPRVACAFGERCDPWLRPLTAPLLQDAAHARRHPFYGYSNSAGGFRRALWVQHPFDEQLAAAEDKEWAWHWLTRGQLVLLDPTLAVHHSHRDEGPLRTFRRARADFAAQRGLLAGDDDVRLPRPSPAELAREWWRGPHAHRSAARARLDPRRVGMLLGKWFALR